MKTNKLAIVVPCYNEEEVLPETSKRLSELLDSLIKEELITTDSFILYVNDGSTDKTWTIIQKLYEKNNHIAGINLSTSNNFIKHIIFSSL